MNHLSRLKKYVSFWYKHHKGRNEEGTLNVAQNEEASLLFSFCVMS
jgi:hypothetical protein